MAVAPAEEIIVREFHPNPCDMTGVCFARKARENCVRAEPRDGRPFVVKRKSAWLWGPQTSLKLLKMGIPVFRGELGQ